MRGHYHCLRTGCYFVTNITTKLPWHIKKHEKAERRAANGFKYFTKREECGRLGAGRAGGGRAVGAACGPPVLAPPPSSGSCVIESYPKPGIVQLGGVRTRRARPRGLPRSSSHTGLGALAEGSLPFPCEALAG